jgi:hypothetical protein
MAVTQISRIQHRRGLQQDLPQLAAAELGWSVDEQRLYIGNGTLEEGAPLVGVTEILTQKSIDSGELIRLIGSYSFFGNLAGYTAQTGPSSLSPYQRSLQDKLDDFVNIRDFGAVGDGVTDDTASINRALQQIYLATVSNTEPRARRTIYFPGGTYVTSYSLTIPTYARLVGDGVNSSIIRLTQASYTVANIVDSKFQNATALGTNGATLPTDIELNNLRFENSNSSATMPVVVIDSAANIKIYNTAFAANTNTANLISVRATVANTNAVTFDSCRFLRSGNAIALTGNVTNLRIYSSMFDSVTYDALKITGAENVISIGNYYGNVGNVISGNLSEFVSLGDNRYGNTEALSGITVGKLQILSTRTTIVDTANLLIPIAANTSGTIKYQISNSSSRRFGELSFMNDYSVSNTWLNDEYSETLVSIGANVTANSDSIIVSLSSGTALLNYNLIKFN